MHTVAWTSSNRENFLQLAFMFEGTFVYNLVVFVSPSKINVFGTLCIYGSELAQIEGNRHRDLTLDCAVFADLFWQGTFDAD